MQNKKPVSVLFVRSDSIYKKLNVDCWDIERDALNYNGMNPVVCHPPCRSWGRLSHVANPRPGESELAIFAVDMVRSVGGIIEHPAGSKLWKKLGLPLGSEVDMYGGFTLSINQSWFGHKAKKNTWLYICGIKACEIPLYPLSFDVVTEVIASRFRKGHYRYRRHVTKIEREATPLLLAEWLIHTASLCDIKNNL